MQASPLLLLPIFFCTQIFLNILGYVTTKFFFTIGGAEKIAYFTHYHSLYFSYLIFGFLVALINLNKFKFKKIIIYSYLFLVVIFYLSFTLDQNNRIRFKFTHHNYLFEWNDVYKKRGEAKQLEDFISHLIPKDAYLSVSEVFLPYVYKYKHVSFFPYNFETADFLLVNYRKINNENVPYFMTFLGEKHSIDSNYVIYRRLKYFGFDFDHPVFINNSGMMILKKLKS